VLVGGVAASLYGMRGWYMTSTYAPAGGAFDVEHPPTTVAAALSVGGAVLALVGLVFLSENTPGAWAKGDAPG
jgi:hypothetical protein